jgi:CRAL/TRIO, N-terminus.
MPDALYLTNSISSQKLNLKQILSLTDIMTVTPDSSTGYVHNLTPTQDAKLRELWVLLFTSAASVLSAVYEVELPEGPPNKLFEVLDRVNEPTVEAIVAALKSDTDAEFKDAPETQGEDKEQKSLDKVDNLMNKDAQKNIMSEMATRKVTPQHFSAVFASLRKMGVQESEIKSMEKILSQMTPEEMVFSILKMIKQEHPDSLLLRFLRARKWDVGKGSP